MSSISFNSINHVARVSGAERALMGQYCARSLLFALGDLNYPYQDPPWIMKHVPEDSYLHESPIAHINTWLSIGHDNLILNGEEYSIFTTQLNSALAIGNDAIKLMARLHGQCEIHCFVEGKNRQWLANIIKKGLDQKIFRGNMGWDEVLELLERDSDGPVVCSYSVSDCFPNNYLAECDEETPYEEQWDLCMEKLRSGEGCLELKPNDWDDYKFGAGISGFDFKS